MYYVLMQSKKYKFHIRQYVRCEFDINSNTSVYSLVRGFLLIQVKPYIFTTSREENIVIGNLIASNKIILVCFQ